ncbi:MAG: bifunctional diaminohydroxyphosphoribosylaminopyrimidine deaminase/5-amino-6-(5-phosphoribosylamino)uracil reductase RibD [Myxococcaceae bacterium]|nr:bifunctional diaminohydroxyphosphoribosylaminopyrimidine deaminase/5-amino-6-(5-phosphoribosylamino)uracil reductase RibD [Myxococcaceae bacterium]
MALALAEATRAHGRTHPNPCVGAVIVKGGKVIGRGYHEKAGAPHAEVMALAKAKKRAKGATLYTTLEPCNHQGKTPPCCDAILAAGISRVVFASSDPNPLVDGRGVARLEAAKVKVARHVLKAEADALNRPFFKYMRTGLPFVTLKVAMTLDGKLATSTGDSEWVSSEASRLRVHWLRSQVDAVLVGAGTVSVDDPQLTARVEGGRNPVRVVLDGARRLSKGARVFDDQARTILVDKPSAPKAVLQHLAQEGLLHVLVEGGANVHQQFLDTKLFDELLVFVAPKLVGNEGITWSGNLGIEQMANAMQLELRDVERIGDDVLLRFTPRR